MTYILIADIGGTNARFARVDANGIHDVRSLKVSDYETPIDAAKNYLQSVGASHPIGGAFAIAGPVNDDDDSSSLTNKPSWIFSKQELKKEFNVKFFDIMNDFEAMALGVPYVDPDKCFKLGEGRAAKNGNIGVIGPGTGLGVASLVWNKRGGYYVPVAGEGGHTTLAHKSDYEWELAKQVKADQDYSHVSFERMCSGKHLAYVYHAVCMKENIKPEPLEPEDITARAIDASCPACVIAVDKMLGLLGCMAGNLALTNSTFGGVYFCGGILPKLGLDFIKKSRLRQEFCAKGRYEGYLEQISTFIVDDDFMPLKGLRDHVQPMLMPGLKVS